MTTPDHDPFEDLPPALREMLSQLGGGADFLPQLQSMLFQGAASGPVNWDLARRVAMQLAADGDRNPTADEERIAAEAFRLAEHWLDEGTLPATVDGGTLVVGRRTAWVDHALTSMRPLVEPVVAASTRSLAELAADQLPQAQELLPPELAGLLGGMDLTAMLAPFGATLAGLQVGQVVGQLATQLLGQYDLGLPTAGRSVAYHVPVNVAAAFDGWDLDATEVAVTLALHEAAHRRLFHAVPWLEAHLHGLIATFANGTRVDAEQLRGLTEELMTGVDPDDPASMQAALEQVSGFHLEPTEEQRRVLVRIQGVICLVQAWARAEAARAAQDRLPNVGRIDEVLRRRRATHGDGERLLAQLLALDLKPEDEEVGDRFVAAVTAERGPDVLRRALAHPENLPDVAELADPAAWLARLDAGDEIPDDLSSLFGDLGEAPHEGSAEERLAPHDDADDDPDTDASGDRDA